MFWTVKRRVFTFIFLPYAILVCSDKTVNIGSALVGVLTGGLMGGLTGSLVSGLTNALPHAAAGGGPNMQTCQSAGCSSYKNITHGDSGDCLNGFICKKCKRTHAKNPSICFYSSLQGYENLYEAHLEDFTQTTPYDNFNVPVDKSSKGKGNNKDASNDSGKETMSGKKSGSNKRDSSLEEEDDGEDKGKLQSRAKGELDDEGEESDVEDDAESEEEDEASDTKDKRGGSEGGNSSQGKNNGGNNFDADSDTESFLQKSTNHLHGKGELHQLVEKNSKSRPPKGEDGFTSLLETHIQLPTNEGRYNSGRFEFAGSSTSAEGAPSKGHSFIQSRNAKEKIVYKRLKINLNKHEEYFKNKLHKCHVGEDGVATFYVKVLLQIVKDKNDIYVDVSRGKASSNMATGSDGQKGTEGQKTNRRSQSGEEEENDEDEETDNDSDSDSESDDERSGGNGAVNKYAYVEVHSAQAKNAHTNSAKPNEEYSFYQVNEDLDGDSMGNYYKSRNGFFKSIFKRVFKKKGESEDDTGGEDEDTDEQPQGKKKKRWGFSWKRRRGGNKQLQGGDGDDEESEDESPTNRRPSGKKRRFFGRSKRNDDNNNNDDDDDNEESDDEESTGTYGQSGAGKKGKDKHSKKGKGSKGGKLEGNTSKVVNLFTKLKKKIIPVKQKLHIEAFFNSIIVKTCKNALKWEGNMFRKQSLVEMTLKVPVKMKYIKKEPLHFFRSGYEVILTCRNCEEVLFNSCVQLYCSKTASKAERPVEHHNAHATGGAVGNTAAVAAGAVAAGALATGAVAAGTLATGTVSVGSTPKSSHLYSSDPSDFSPILMFDYNGQYFPGNVNSETDYNNSEGHLHVIYPVILATLMIVLLV